MAESPMPFKMCGDFDDQLTEQSDIIREQELLTK